MESNLTCDGAKRQGRLTHHLRWLSPSLVALAVLTFVGLAAPAAKADTYDFTMTDTNNLFNITFSVPGGVVPASSAAGSYFTLDSVAYSINGTSESPATMDFYSTTTGGGMDLYNGSAYVLNQGGAQLYPGPESSPTFLTGTFDLTDLGGATIAGDNFTLTITDPGPSMPAPEPSSLLLLGAGLLGLGGLVAYQQKKNGQLLARDAA